MARAKDPLAEIDTPAKYEKALREVMDGLMLDPPVCPKGVNLVVLLNFLNVGLETLGGMRLDSLALAEDVKKLAGLNEGHYRLLALDAKRIMILPHDMAEKGPIKRLHDFYLSKKSPDPERRGGLGDMLTRGGKSGVSRPLFTEDGDAENGS